MDNSFWEVSYPSQSSIRPEVLNKRVVLHTCTPQGIRTEEKKKLDLRVGFVRLFSDLEYWVTVAQQVSDHAENCFLCCGLEASQKACPQLESRSVRAFDTPMEAHGAETAKAALRLCVKSDPCRVAFTVIDDGSSEFELKCRFQT